MPLGYSDLKTVVRLPGTWDLTYLKKWAMMDGTTYDQVVRQMAAALLLFNRSLTQDYWAQYLQVVTTDNLEYDVGGESAELNLVSEYGRPDPIVGEFTGHMLPLKDYGGSLGWTYMVLRRAVPNRLNRDVRRLIDRSRNTWSKRILERMFWSAAETVGTSGVSVPWADGGTADSSYIPVSMNGKIFANTHNHFSRTTDDAAGRETFLVNAAAHLKEHGVNSPWDLVIPEVDRTDFTALNSGTYYCAFKKPERGVLSTAGVEVRALVPEEEYIGIIEVDAGYFKVREETRLPTNYAGVFKPPGFNSPAAPVAVRIEDGYPLGLTLVGEFDQFPLQEAIAYFTFGAGIVNRVAGMCGYFAGAGNYVDPTIS